MTELQKKLLEIYKVFDKLCVKLQIQYIASDGTLLGAIRHQGFIPWDDDMDFRMTRENYNKLIKEGPKLIEEPYFIQSFDTDCKWPLPFAKIRDSSTTAIEEPFIKIKDINQGVWIDIFPMDSIKATRSALVFKNIKYSLARRRLFKNSKPTFKEFFYKFLSVVFIPSTKRATIILSGNVLKQDDSNFLLASPSDNLCNRNKLFKKEWFENLMRVKFEDTTIPVPVNYLDYLVSQYGDWKTPPPLNKRKACHEIVVLNLEKPYWMFYDENK